MQAGSCLGSILVPFPQLCAALHICAHQRCRLPLSCNAPSTVMSAAWTPFSACKKLSASCTYQVQEAGLLCSMLISRVAGLFAKTCATGRLDYIDGSDMMQPDAAGASAAAPRPRPYATQL